MAPLGDPDSSSLPSATVSWVLLGNRTFTDISFPFDFLFDTSDLCFPILSLISSFVILKSISSAPLPFGDVEDFSVVSFCQCPVAS